MSGTHTDRRLWAITLAHEFAKDPNPDQGPAMEERTVQALRDVGADGLILGLTDLAAHLMQNIADHSALTLDELAWAIRENALPPEAFH